MSRYLLLFLLTLPFAFMGIVSATTQHKLLRTSRKRFTMQMVLWTALIIGIALTEPIYEWLFSHNLTQTESLSLFDVVQITGIVIVYYIANRTRIKVENLEKRVQDLHQELSIRFSNDKST